MKYFILNNEVYAFEADGSQDDYILEGMVAMTGVEILKHETNPNTDYHVWNGSAWIDQRTQEEIAVYERSLLQKLSKRQFSLYLYDNDMYDQVMQAIEANPRFKIEYDTVSEIERLSPTVAEMSNLLGWTDERVDEMWTYAMTL